MKLGRTRSGAAGSAGSVTVDRSVRIGSVQLPSAVLCASGTAGHGDELARYFDLSSIGAVVVKSLSVEPWPGNPAPRVHQTPAGMLNSVGLQGPGIEAWRRHGLPELLASGTRVVASIWGRSVEDFAAAADALGAAELPARVVALEVNLSCPNLDGGSHLFAHDPDATIEVLRAVAARWDRPIWAKLSPNTDRLVEVAGAAATAGAEAVTLVNTVMGMVIDTEHRRPLLGAGRGGLSGPAMHPVAVRAVYDCRAAWPELPIVGVGGVASGVAAVELLLAGAQAVQVGTATFAEPAAAARVDREITEWCRDHGVAVVSELSGQAQR